MQLPFAIFPLVMFTSDRKRMGEMVNPWWLIITAYTVCFLIAALNVKLLVEQFGIMPVLGIFLAIGGFALWATRWYKPRALEAPLPAEGEGL